MWGWKLRIDLTICFNVPLKHKSIRLDKIWSLATKPTILSYGRNNCTSFAPEVPQHLEDAKRS